MNDKVYVLVSVLNMLFWLIANLAFGMFITWKLSCLFYLAWIFLIPIGVAISPLCWIGYCRTDDFINRMVDHEA